MRTAAVAFILALLTPVSAALAQLIDSPPGAVGGVFGGRRPVDPNRSSQSLDVNADFSFGYEHDPNAFLLGPEGEGAERLTNWYATTAYTSARYRVGHVRRSLEARGRGLFNYQSNFGDSLIGGEAVLNGAAGFGRRALNRLNVRLQASYEPGWVFGTTGTESAVAPDDAAGLGVAPPQGVIEQRWLVLAESAGYEHHWNARHTTTLEFHDRHLRPLEGGGLDSDSQVASVEQGWSPRESVTLLGAYRLDQNRQQDELGPAPRVRFQTVDGGLQYLRRLTSTRRYSLSMRAGATQIFDSTITRPLRRVHPSFSGTAELTLSRVWGLSAEVSRNVTLLAGISAVPVLNDSVELNLNGSPSRKLRFSVFGSFARAKSVTSDIARASVVDVAGATAEIRYAITTWSAVFGSYGFYHHQLDDASIVVAEFPSRYDRHSARIGLSLWIPLYGSF